MNHTLDLDLPLKEIAAYCETLPIQRLSLLGPDFDGWLRPDTDIGLLVEYMPEATVTYLDMAGQEIDIGAMIGARIDLRTPYEIDGLSKVDLVATARLIYAQNS